MKTVQIENFNALKLLANVAKELKDSEFKSTRLRKISPKVKQLSEYLELTENQTIMFSLIFALLVDRTHNLDMSDIACYVSVDYIQLLTYQKDLEYLIDKRYVEAKNKLRFSNIPLQDAVFKIDGSMIDAICMNEKIVLPEKKINKGAIAFVHDVSDLIEFRADEKINSHQLFREVNYLEKEYEHLDFVKYVTSCIYEDDERTLFYEICKDFLKHGRSDLDITIQDIFEDIEDKTLVMKQLKDEKHKLQEMNLIKISGEGFITDAEIKLTNKGLEVFLGEDAKIYMKTGNETLLNPEKLAYKPLFYNPVLKKQVDFLTESLSAENHKRLQERLSEKSLPKGISSIFYGAPGTGKTETVYQLAKQTGREIMQVDISQSKSMWFGESEKKIKEIFDNYKRACEKREIKPILLFNEADAIFGKRKDSTFSNVAQTENAIQNIILEEMEKLDGILIATTNLNENLDKAFERRFLFKVKFDNPDKEIKAKIWKSKMPLLTDNEADFLAERFSLSGGEIENVVRKITMDEIVFGNKISFEQIVEFCEAEKFDKENGRGRIGF